MKHYIITKPFILLKLIAIYVAVILCLFYNPTHAEPVQVPPSANALLYSYAPIVKSASPSVVNIYTSQRVKVKTPFSPLLNDPFFNQFFRHPLAGMEQEREVQSLGSGVIIDNSGLVITSLHVVKGAEDIKIVLNDRREFSARIALEDPSSDLALLQVNNPTTPFPAIQLTDSDGLEVGDLVLAIGNPFGVGQTVTSGIVSGLARSASGVNDYDFFIQTDAAINPGNSGGALVDMQGRLVGINTAIYSQTGGSVGIGFAIPSNMVSALLRNRTPEGTLSKAWLGAEYQEVTPAIANSLGLKQIKGVLVTDIFPDSPAAKAGLSEGDIITAFDGKPVDSVAALKFRIGTAIQQTPVPLTVIRNGDNVQKQITLTPPPKADKVAATLLTGRHPLNGVTVAALSPTLSLELGLPASAEGVVVVDIPRDRMRAFVAKGDIIVECNGKAITSIRDLEKTLLASPRNLTMTMVRDGSQLQLKIVQ